MDRTLSDLLSLRLCQRIEHATVRQWCQGEVDKDPSAFAGAASQRLAQLAVLEIAPTELVRAYWDAKLGQDT